MSTNSKNSIIQILDTFEPINLDQMDDVRFLKRMDIKYVFHISRLENLLNDIKKQYHVLFVNNSAIQEYETVYFDTALLDMYQQHHNGLRDRYKIRARQYINSNLFFLEVKTKNNKGITSKKRMKLDSLDLQFSEKSDKFIADKTPFFQANLQTTIKNKFSRITLVNEKTPERITIDWNLSFINSTTGKELALPNACIFEIKRNSLSRNRQLDQVLKMNKIFPSGFSKYCMGVALLEPSLKMNRFKPNLHKLRKEEIIH